MKLRVALSHDSLEWRQALDQEKVSYTVLHERPSHLNREEYPVLLLTGIHDIQLPLLVDFARQGGMLIGDQGTEKALRLTVPTNHLIIVEERVKETMADLTSCSKHFTKNGIQVTETVATTHKAKVRLKVIDAIKRSFWMQNLPYVHLWYYPDTYNSVFGFRLDFDEYEASDFQTMCALINTYRAAITCFPCMRTYEKRGDCIKQLVALQVEIGSHGYIHHVYQSYRENNWNLARAEQLLKAYVPSVEGFCGPHGVWNPALQSVLEARGYLYSSEFGLNYDDMPFFPVCGSKHSTVLQIPTHPVCEGLFLERYGYTPNMIEDYFASVIEDKIRAREPLFFFGHPTRRLGRYPSILEHIFRCVEEASSVLHVPFGTFAKWWMKRYHAHTEFEWKNSCLWGYFSTRSNRITAEVITPDQQRTLIPITKFPQSIKFPQSFILKSQNATSQNIVADCLLEQTANHNVPWKMKTWLKTLLDWEVKTPISMLSVYDFRSLIKYLLRCCHDLFTGTTRVLRSGTSHSRWLERRKEHILHVTQK